MSGWLVEVFGAVAVGVMALTYALEHRSPHFTLVFAIACVASGAYALAIGSWPFATIESLWSVVALRRWRDSRTGSTHTIDDRRDREGTRGENA